MATKETIEKINAIVNLLDDSTQFVVFAALVSYLEDIPVNTEDISNLKSLTEAYQEYLKADSISSMLNDDIREIIARMFDEE